MAPLPFVRVGARYRVAWNGTEESVLRIVEVGPGAWVKADVNSRQLWFNLDAARSVAEAQ
jgi:hypothetical protein